MVGRLARPRRQMRAGLVQLLLCAVAGLALGLLLPRITTEASVASTRLTETLVAVGFGVLGLTSLIFTLLFLVAQWAFGSLSPCLEVQEPAGQSRLRPGAHTLQAGGSLSASAARSPVADEALASALVPV